MAPTKWGLLPQADEDALHNVSRLLSIEARPYLRVSSRLTKSGALSDLRSKQLLSPPPDASAADEDAAARVAEQDQKRKTNAAWVEGLMSELSLLEYTTLRFELTTDVNAAERERYANEQVAIQEKQKRVRGDIEQLRVDLDAAKKTLEVRKTYDDLTEKITSSKMLRPRDEQAVAHAKLDEEIAELEQEVQTAKATWAERREQFNRIHAEAMNMMRMIKDEKEEAERKEGMMKDRDDEADGEGGSIVGDASQVGTPRPEGAATPMHATQANELSSGLKVPHDRLAPLSRDPSVAASPARSAVGDDTEMGDSGELVESTSDLSEIEEGEDIEDGEEDGERSEVDMHL